MLAEDNGTHCSRRRIVILAHLLPHSAAPKTHLAILCTRILRAARLFTSFAVRFVLTRPRSDVHIFIKIVMNLESGGRAVIDSTNSLGRELLATRVQRERATVLHAFPLVLCPRRRAPERDVLMALANDQANIYSS